MTVRPTLLDLYSGAGGAARGYQRAGFRVTGVDLRPQPRYAGDAFIQADALTYVAEHGHEYNVIHASPPCQRYIRGGLQHRDGRYADLVPATRRALEAVGRPWIIENVPGSPLRPDLVLCGSMFGLRVRRHRWFEGGPHLATTPLVCDHSQPVVGVYGHPHGLAGAWPGMLPGTPASWQQAMGITWMTTSEMALAIPPAYCQFIGEQWMLALQHGDGDRFVDSWPEHTAGIFVSPDPGKGSPRSTDDPAGSESYEHSDPSVCAATAASSRR